MGAGPAGAPARPIRDLPVRRPRPMPSPAAAPARLTSASRSASTTSAGTGTPASGTYLRSRRTAGPHTRPTGGQVSRRTTSSCSCLDYRPSRGRRRTAPRRQTVGSGDVYVFTDGTVQSSGHVDAATTAPPPFTLTDADGTPIKLDPGRTLGRAGADVGRRRPGDDLASLAGRSATPCGAERAPGLGPGIAVDFGPARSAAATGTFPVKRGLAEMLKGGVIMDVVTPEQAKIAEDAGACAVMALERVPADIRRDGGVARMSDPEMIEGIKAAVIDPGDGQGPHRPLRRGPDPRGARRRLRRRVARCSPRPTRPTTSTSGRSPCRSCAAPPTSARRCGASARARR